MRIQRVILEHHRNIAVFRMKVVYDTLADDNIPACLLLQACDHPQRGGFAAA